MRRYTYTFRCPVCSKDFKSDEPGEPLCTGPSEMRDDHPPEFMHLKKIQAQEVPKEYAVLRAQGTLIMPYMERSIAREALILKV